MKVYLTTYYDPEKKELNDTEVLRDLNNAASLYEDGAIVECRFLLQRIIKAIKKFEKEYCLFESDTEG